jgi:hypothetical protein
MRVCFCNTYPFFFLFAPLLEIMAAASSASASSSSSSKRIKTRTEEFEEHIVDLAKPRPLVIVSGCSGVNKTWTGLALGHHFKVQYYTFINERRLTPPPHGVESVFLSDHHLAKANKSILTTSCALRTTLPHHARPFVQREWCIATAVDAVVACGEYSPNFPGVGVRGGTQWTCQMYVDYRMATKKPVHLWLLNDRTQKWMKLVGREGDKSKFTWEDTTKPSIESFSKVCLCGPSTDHSSRGVFQMLQEVFDKD